MLEPEIGPATNKYMYFGMEITIVAHENNEMQYMHHDRSVRRQSYRPMTLPW